MSKIDFKSTPEYSDWWDENRTKLVNFSIYSKGAAIWNAASSLAAPVVSAAPSGDLPPLPKEFGQIDIYGDDGIVKFIDGYTADQMRGYAIDYGMKLGRAAIAHQPPKEALTDAKIRDIWCGLGGQDRWLKDFGFIQFARRIEAASAPNKQLVAALQSVLAMPRGTSGRIIIDKEDEDQLRIVLTLAGVAPLPQAKEGV